MNPEKLPPTDAGDPRDLGFDIPPPATLKPGRAVLAVAALVLALGAAFAFGFVPKWRAKKELTQQTAAFEGSLPKVQVVAPTQKTGDSTISLPGSIEALEETILYPRASGYVRRWLADIGDKVKENDLLAEIDTPELDQQLEQARAELARSQAALVQSQANHEFSAVNLERYQQLAPKGIASQQELDKQRAQSQVDEANVKVAKATIDAQQANIRRLLQMKSFSRVVAPFTGTVNARMIERGALVSPGTPLFKVSVNDPVRVIVRVPQDVATSMRVDAPANVTVREYAGRTFEGKVARTAAALDPASRTMTTEIRVPNPKSELLSGMYANVSLSLPSPRKLLEIPPTAVMEDARGVRVAVVDAASKIHFVPISIERDTGSSIEVASGLEGSERIVRLVSAEIVEGRSVDVVQ